MVVNMENVAALYADVYPTKLRGRNTMDCLVSDCAKRQKQRPKSLPALVEDDSEPLEAFELEQKPRRPLILQKDALRRQLSVSPHRRERLRRQVMPSLSEDEEP